MKVLFVASVGKGRMAPFVVEQAEALSRAGVEVSLFGIDGHGVRGYLSALPSLVKRVRSFRPDVIHAHYGLSGLLACMCRRPGRPVVVTYHGSDINVPSVLRLSRIAIRLSSFNIFVSPANVAIAGVSSKYALIPCGVDVPLEIPSAVEARAALGWDVSSRKVLFAGAFDNEVKNYPLARAAVELLNSSASFCHRDDINVGAKNLNQSGSDVSEESQGCVAGTYGAASSEKADLIELKGYSRSQVTTLMCACDALLMTSFTEGSPQVVKEALVCGCPVVSVDVGDVASVTSGVEGCYIVERDAESIASALSSALDLGRRTEGLHRIESLGLTNDRVAHRLISVYESLLSGSAIINP